MIKMEHLIHRYTIWKSETEKSKKTVLDGISCDIPSGQFIGILGPNGSGKSTLAKHMNVLLLPDEGTIWIDGKNTADREKLWEIREEGKLWVLDKEKKKLDEIQSFDKQK